ncbi:MAG: SusC/RagA family TonB-linked outer membrane protein [Bacteroidia bacterium]
MRQHFYTKLSIVVCLTCLGWQFSFAQGIISGKVKNAKGEALSGTTLLIEGQQLGAFADENGAYSIEGVPAGSATVLTQIYGYKNAKKTVTVQNGQTVNLDFTLEDSTSTIDEVVVVGYGVQRRRDLVGSVAKIGSEKLNDNVGISVETALQGKAPGIQIIQGSGAAGSGSLIRVRGIGSISSGGEPLYVIDGIPISQDVNVTGGLDGMYPNVNNNPLNSINPNDIESVEILKDASAAAIYGSRAANGVVLITTKKGKSGNKKPQFNYSSSIGIARPTRILPLLNSKELLLVRQEAWENDGNTGRAPLPSVYSGSGYTHQDAENTQTNWYDHVIRTGLKQEHSLSMNQGSEKWTNYVGATYTDNESYLVGNTMRRYSGRWNMTFKPIKSLDFGFNSSLAQTNIDRVRQEFGSPLGLAQSYALPFYPIYEKDNKTYFNLYNNPVAQLDLQKWESRETRTINNVFVNYRPIKGLTLNVTGSYDNIRYNDYVHEDSLWTRSGDVAKYYGNRTRNWNTYGTAQYDFKLPNEKHKLSIMVGTEYQSTKQRFAAAKYRDTSEVNYLDKQLYAYKDIDTTKVDWSPADIRKFEDSTSLGDQSLFASVFTRLNYKYDDRFIMQATFRRDGSSKFGANRRFGNFPSLGVGYVLSEESFFKNSVLAKSINFIKVKASWGVTGNANLDWRRQFATYNFPPPNNPLGNGAYNNEPIRFQNKLENPDLQWEVANTYDAGLEMGFLNDRITLDFAYYYRLTTKAAIRTTVQASAGIDNVEYLQNTGEIMNHGVEFSLNTTNIRTKNFTWKTNFNITRNTNKVLAVGSASPDALEGGFGDMRTVVGYPVATNYTIKFSHIDAATGRPVYLDKAGNETFTYDPAANRQAVGSGIPLFVGGLTNTFSYKEWDFNFLFVFNYGGKIYDDAAKRQLGVITMEDAWNYRREILDRWQKPGDTDTYLPKYTTDMKYWGGSGNAWQNNTSLWLENASYLRLRNIQLGYNLPIKPNYKIRSVRFTLTGNNIWTLTDYTGWDPEVVRGVDNNQKRNIGAANNTFLTPPQEKSFLFGVNVGF